MDVTTSQALAFRLAGQDLAAPVAGPAEVLHSWAVQDSPPGAATAAVLARTGRIAPGWLDAALYEDRSAVALYNARTATAVLPASEVAAFATAHVAEDDAGLRAIVGPALPEHDEGYAEPVELAVAAIADALDGTVLRRDDLHEALRRRLPPELLPWCAGCKSHHARRGLLVMASLHGRLCLTGRAGRQPVFGRTDQWVAWAPPKRDHAGAELVRRHLRSYGPSSPAQLAQTTGLGTAHARALWALAASELHEVRIDGTTRAWILARDLPQLEQPPPAPGVRLLAAGDPLLLGRDRERLLPGAALRRKLWTAIGAPGLVLADGEPAALWRARKEGGRLTVTVEPFRSLPRAAVEEETARLAAHRGAATADVVWI